MEFLHPLLYALFFLTGIFALIYCIFEPLLGIIFALVASRHLAKGRRLQIRRKVSIIVKDVFKGILDQFMKLLFLTAENEDDAEEVTSDGPVNFYQYVLRHFYADVSDDYSNCEFLQAEPKEEFPLFPLALNLHNRRGRGRGRRIYNVNLGQNDD